MNILLLASAGVLGDTARIADAFIVQLSTKRPAQSAAVWVSGGLVIWFSSAGGVAVALIGTGCCGPDATALATGLAVGLATGLATGLFMVALSLIALRLR